MTPVTPCNSITSRILAPRHEAPSAYPPVRSGRPRRTIHLVSVVAALRSLIERGEDINAANARKETPLLTAGRQGSNAIVRALGELGVDLNAKDIAGKTAPEIVTGSGRNQHEDTAAILRELAATRVKQ